MAASQYYKVTAYVGTPHRNAVEVTLPLVGPAGPAGPAGTGLETLTTPGDTLYQGQTTGERLPIGSAGQVLKVVNGFPAWGNESGAVTSVNGETGAVVLDAGDVGAVPTGNNAEFLRFTNSLGEGPVRVQSFTEGGGGVNGIYWPTGGLINSKPVYKLNRTYGMFFENDRWHIYENSPVTQNIVASSNDDNRAYPDQSAWSGDVDPANVADFGFNATQQFQFVGDLVRVPTTSTSGLPLKTGTNGVIEAGSFGTAAGSFCAGDDARLSDARTPSSTLAHKASHATGGTDALAPSDIGAAWALETRSNQFTSTSTYTLAQGRNVQLNVRIPANNAAGTITLPRLTTDSAQNGDDLFIVWESGSGSGQSLTIERYIWTGSSYIGSTEAVVTATALGAWRFRLLEGAWELQPVATHVHAAADITSGTLDVARLPVGTGSTQVAAGNHTHTVADVTGAAAAGSITTSGLTQATARILGRTTASTGAVEEIQIGSGLSLSAGELSSTVSAGVTAVGASTADVLSVSGSDLVADDPNADRIVFWDDSESKLRYLEAGSGLSLSGTTLTATATGTIGGSSGSVDNAILRADGTGGSTLQNSAINIDDATTSTQANVAITNQHSETNSALVLTPKGTGAFIVGPKPDGTTTGGNARGAYAADLQLTRDGAAKVASGGYSMCAGLNSTASGFVSVAIGWSVASTTNGAATVGGLFNTASGTYAGVFAGALNTASSFASLALTTEALANRVGIIAIGGGKFSGAAAQGEAQRIMFLFRGKTTNGAATEIFNNISNDTGNQRLTARSGYVMSGIINCTGVKSDGSAVAHYVRQFSLKNVGGTTTLVGAVTTIGADQEDNASTDIAVTANDTDDALKIEVTGIASETWRWIVSVDAVEVQYGS